MHYRVLLRSIKQAPFKPFDVVMSNGERYRIDHPENVALSRDSVVIPIYRRNPPAEVADDFVYASYLHIAALEPVQATRNKKHGRE